MNKLIKPLIIILSCLAFKCAQSLSFGAPKIISEPSQPLEVVISIAGDPKEIQDSRVKDFTHR